MKTSPLLLDHYFLSDLHFSVNRKFKGDKEPELVEDQFEVQPNFERDKGCPKKWQVDLRLKCQLKAGVNSPYAFSLEIVGFFRVAEGFPKEKSELLVKTNGSSILYGIAREIVRDLTSRGPYPGMMLPSVSFYESVKRTEIAPSDVPQDKKPKPDEPGSPEGEPKR